MKRLTTSPALLFCDIKRITLTGLVGAIALLGAVAEGKTKESVPPAVELLCPAVKVKKGEELTQNQKRQSSLRKKLIRIANGEDINATDKNGQTALMYAAAQNNRLAVFWLVAKGADVTCTTPKGKTAIMYTTDSGIRGLLEICAREKDAPTDEEEERLQERFGSDEKEIRKNLFLTCEYPSYISTALKMGINLNGSHNEKLLAQMHISPESYAYLVRAGYSVDARAENGETALRPEIPRELAQLMLTLGMQINPENAEQALWAALYANDPKGVTAALKKNADLLGDSTQAASKFIHYADSGAVVRALISAGLKVKDTWEENGKQVSLLHAAIMGGGNDTVVKELLAAGCPIPEKGEGLLKLIAENCPQAGATAKLLVDAGVKVTDEDLAAAVVGRSLPLVKLALEKGANARQEAGNPAFPLLHNLYNGAPHKDIPAIAELLINAGLSLDDTREYMALHGGGVRICPNATPLHIALLRLANQTRFGEHHWFYDPTLTAERELKLTILRALINAMDKVPADILLYTGGEDLTPRQWGDIALLLLDKGADPKAQTDSKDTTLMIIGCYDPRVALRLMEEGVDAKAQNSFDVSVLCKVRSEDVVDVLVEAGADKNVIESLVYDCPPATIGPVVKRLLQAGAEPGNALARLGARGAHSAALRDEDYAAVAEALIAAGAKVNPFEIDWYEVVPALLKPILTTGIDVNAQNEAGNTILMHWISAKMINTKSLHILLQAGAKTDILNKDGKNALQLAREKQLNNNIIKLLEDHTK